MALTKSNAAASPAPAPVAAKLTTPVGSFESMDETTSSKPAANDAISGDAADVAGAPAAPAPSTSTEVAVKPAAAVVTSTKAEASAFQKEVEAMRGAADFRHGNYKIFKGNQGEIMQTGGDKLGRWIKVSMLAWDDHYEISPGSDSDKSKDFVGYSKDGVTIDSIIGQAQAGYVGGSVDDYLRDLRGDLDYPNSKKGRFIDIACIVHECESNEDYAGEVIQVTLSQSSIPSFSSYQEQLVMKAKAVARGIPGVKVPEDPFTFYFIREAAEKNGKAWTKLNVVTKLPNKI